MNPCLILSIVSLAVADPEPAVDVTIHDTARPARVLTLEWNPLGAFTIGRESVNVIISPVDHHSIIISPFYAWTNTADIYQTNDQGKVAALAVQRFKGIGAELGYRHYSSTGGPRGFFWGPSLILAFFRVRTVDGNATDFLHYGLAADVGYQTLIADRVSISIGGGLEYFRTTTSLPDQQFPAKLYANNSFLPRALLSVGWAF